MITEKKAPIRAFSWIEVATIALTFENLLRHYARVQKSPHKFMLTSFMKYFAKFLAILTHNTSYLKIYITCISFCYFIFSKF